jgi:Flp pilus assembly protein TadD
LLLDRRRIRKWAKWVALALAVFFAAGFLLMGIGGSGVNVLDIFQGCSETTPTETSVADTQLDKLLAALAADSTNTTKMLEIAAYYERLYSPTDGTGREYAGQAANYYEQALEADPSLKEVYLDLGKLYIEMSSPADAARILNMATSVDPDNAEVYYYLGRAQQMAGKKGETILAWQKYLQLAPEGRLAETVRAQLEQLTAPSTTTTSAPTTTTGAVATSTTVASSTTTASD